MTLGARPTHSGIDRTLYRPKYLATYDLIRNTFGQCNPASIYMYITTLQTGR